MLPRLLTFFIIASGIEVYMMSSIHSESFRIPKYGISAISESSLSHPKILTPTNLAQLGLSRRNDVDLGV